MKQSREYSWSLRHTPKGPLVPYVDAFTGLLSTQGYAQTSVHLYTRLVADFSGWLKQKNVTKEEITLEHTERYLRYRACHRRPRTGEVAALRRLLHLLHEEGKQPEPVVVLQRGAMALDQVAQKTKSARIHELGKVHQHHQSFLPVHQDITPAALSPLRRQNPREEPGALAARAGIRAGGEEQSSSLPRP